MQRGLFQTGSTSGPPTGELGQFNSHLCGCVLAPSMKDVMKCQHMWNLFWIPPMHTGAVTPDSITRQNLTIIQCERGFYFHVHFGCHGNTGYHLWMVDAEHVGILYVLWCWHMFPDSFQLNNTERVSADDCITHHAASLCPPARYCQNHPHYSCF